jgi:DNA invertase Pin-like site-specific DNA recombinase
MRFVLYVRASTKDKQHPDHQLAELQNEAAIRGWTVAATFIEMESGKRDDRPEWTKAVGLVLQGKADGIAAVELSRFGRSLRHLLEVGAAFDRAGKHLVCTRQPIDTTNAVGRLVFALLGAVAEFEAELTRERVRAGVQHAKRKRGGSWGRQREVLPAATLQQARQWIDAGLSLRRVAARLYASGHAQPRRDRGRSAHPARPWPIPTLARALAAVQLPLSESAPKPATDAGQ